MKRINKSFSLEMWVSICKQVCLSVITRAKDVGNGYLCG